MARNEIYLGRAFGIPISLDYSWFFVFGLITWMLAGSYYPEEFPNWTQGQYWTMGAVTALLYFGSLLLHELGHSLVALSYRIRVRSITLFMFGGVAQIEGQYPHATAEFLVAVAGPAVNFVLWFLCHALMPAAFDSPPLMALLKYLAYINVALGLFNLIPGFPLDGGRVFRAILWSFTKDLYRATYVAVQVGRGFAFLFVAWGLLRILSGGLGDGLWIIFLGWFLNNAAKAELMRLFMLRNPR
jgi:Zn-dependent protease